MVILVFDDIMFIDLTPYKRESEVCYKNSFAFSNVLFQNNFEGGKEGQNKWGKSFRSKSQKIYL